MIKIKRKKINQIYKAPQHYQPCLCHVKPESNELRALIDTGTRTITDAYPCVPGLFHPESHTCMPISDLYGVKQNKK